MVEAIIAALSGVPVAWRVCVLSMFPVTELRVALPLGVAWGLPLSQAFFWSVCGNFIPIIPLLLLLRWAYSSLIRTPLFRRPLERLSRYGRRNEEKVRRYGRLGLLLFVAVPLPGTGIWSGCLLAALLGLPFWSSVLSIGVGMLVAGGLVALVTGGVLEISRLIELDYLLIALLLAAAAWLLFSGRKR